MDFLKEMGYKSLLSNIKQSNDEALIYSFICNSNNAKEVINYFQSIGIMVIDQLLVKRLEIFTINIEKIKSAFDNYDLDILVQLINEDINTLSFL